MGDKARPQIDKELIDRVDEALERGTGLPVEKLSLEDKLKALVTEYETTTFHRAGGDELAERVQRVEQAVGEIARVVRKQQASTQPEPQSGESEPPSDTEEDSEDSEESEYDPYRDPRKERDDEQDGGLFSSFSG